MFFFYKQKTAYEMRISDWSSDVCSSDLPKGVIYIGVTNDLARRVEQHRSGTISSFTKKYQCHRLVWFEYFEGIHDARVVERRMKAWKREWKIKRIEERDRKSTRLNSSH